MNNSQRLLIYTVVAGMLSAFWSGLTYLLGAGDGAIFGIGIATFITGFCACVWCWKYGMD